MKYLLLFIILTVPTFQAHAYIFSVNEAAKDSCEEIASRGDQYGRVHGQKSRGLSFGTTAANIILSLQQLNDINYKESNPDNDRSIYTICKYALDEINKIELRLLDSGHMRSDTEKYIKRNIKFVRLLKAEVDRVNDNGGLIVFVSFSEPE